MKYTDEQRIKKIYEYAVSLWDYVSNNVDRSTLLTDIHMQWLVTTPLYNIGEQVYYLSDGFKKEHDSIDWIPIAGLRHRLVHDYDGTNWEIISDVVYEEIPKLIEEVRKLM
ncbi:MAG: DUF86 domain-containing protein [Lachnospiraceae bacterium]|nr:DUF86 domain-containing protein [Lachnospiraceae bacterium]